MAQTSDELAKEQMLKGIYQKLMARQAVYPSESNQLASSVEDANKLTAARTGNGAYEDLYNANLGDSGSFGMRTASIKEALFDAEPTVNHVQMSQARGQHAASYPSMPSQEDIFMSSMIKDTPHGNYANTIAKTLAESNVAKSNYSQAFKGLQNAASNNFEAVLDDSPELAHPNNIDTAHKYYDLLVTYAPSLAMKPAVASSFIKTTISYGGVDPKQIGDLIKINNDSMKHHSSLEGGM